ncbi:MAG: tetratricopeptide repeat protein [Candidatus Aminicenantes bacterium]|nr:tetratricopeptide repeat protein [Candidatus Aminicenantes bacterium]
MKRLPVSIPVLLIFALSFFPPAEPVGLKGQAAPTGQNKKGSAPAEGLIPVPTPQLQHLEKAVSDQLREGRRMVDAVVRTASVSLEERARAYCDLGQLYHAYKLTDAAEACYRNAVFLAPSTYEWNYCLASLLQSLGKYSEALEFYRQADAMEKKPILVYLVKIRIGECYLNLNRSGLAKQAFEAASLVKPQGAAVQARLGETALREKRFDDAIRYFQSALKTQPDANKLFYSLGMAYRGKGDMEQARLHLSKYGKVGIQPPDPLKKRLEKLIQGYRVHLLAGRLAYAAGRYVEAAEEFRKAVEANPQKAAGKINLGSTLGYLGKYREATTFFQAALQIAPDNVTAHFNLGAIYRYLGNYDTAIKHLQVVVEKSPKDAKAHLTLADALQENRRLEKAFEHYRAARKLDPGMTSPWINISQLSSLAGRYDEALQVLEDAYSRMPHNGPIAHALAHRLAASPDGSKRQGERALELALKVYRVRQNYEYARTVAMAYAELNRCEKAIEWMEVAIELAAGSPQAGSVLKVLQRNLAHFKSKRPCRVPAK